MISVIKPIMGVSYIVFADQHVMTIMEIGHISVNIHSYLAIKNFHQLATGHTVHKKTKTIIIRRQQLARISYLYAIFLESMLTSRQ